VAALVELLRQKVELLVVVDPWEDQKENLVCRLELQKLRLQDHHQFLLI
jgi:hypothetical protein